MADTMTDTMTDTQIVNAIQARVTGVYDHPDLARLGPLHCDQREDIVRLLALRRQTPQPAHASDCAMRFHSASECTCGFCEDEG
jgi:hypothetical protein